MGGRFQDAFQAQTGKAVDKWEQYLAVYDREIGPLVAERRPLRLLEIGVQNGGSLEVWHRYLPEGSHVIGLDIDPAVAGLRFASSCIKALVVNALDEAAVTDVLGNERFDIIIDDGSHLCGEVRSAFEQHWQRLAAGGRYVIEDLHTSYYSSHEGGLRRLGSSIEFLKDMIDAMHSDHMQSPKARNTRLWQQLAQKTVGRIAFYDSIAVVEKLPSKRRKPFRRLVNGENAQVVPHSVWSPDMSADALQNLMLGRSSLRRVDPQLRRAIADRDAMIDALRLERDEALEKLRLLSEARYDVTPGWSVGQEEADRHGGL